jgi:hypothetical protein
MATTSLPGFKKIDFAPAGRVQAVAQEWITEGVPVDVFGEFFSLPVCGLIDCESKTEKVSGQTVYTTKLTLQVRDCGTETRRLLERLSRSDMIYRLTDVAGGLWFLGTGEKPFPVLSPQFNSEGKPAGQRVFSVEIQYVNLFGLLKAKYE